MRTSNERGRPVGGLFDSHFYVHQFERPAEGVLTPVGRQNRKRRPTVGAQLLKTW
jgi:hypothetical protein